MILTDSPLALGNEVLGGGFYAAWLYRDLRTDSGYVYSVSTDFDLKKHRGDYSVTFGSDPDKVAPAAALVVRDLKRMRGAPPPDSDVNRAKGILLRRIPLGESSFGAIAGQLLNDADEDKPLDEDIVAARPLSRPDAGRGSEGLRGPHPP